MNIDVAYLLCRMQAALVDEGIGPKKAPEGFDYGTDHQIMAEAAHLVDQAELMNVHEMWDFGLVSDKDHTVRCDCYDAKKHRGEISG